MAQVTGIGGYFLRATDPGGLAAWYSKALGVGFEGDGTMAVLPDTGGGYAVFSLFPKDSEYIGRPESQQAMVNLRVDDLTAVLAHLGDLGIEHEGGEDSEYGRFGWVVDPEGNRVELWEPPVEPA